MMVRAAIFDLDDTLVYTTPEFEQSWTKRCLQEFSDKPFTDAQIAEYLKKPIPEREEVLKRLGFAHTQQYMDMWLTDETIAKYVEFMGIFPDATVLKDLKRQGITLGMVTSGDLRRVSKQIRKLEQTLGESIFDPNCVVNIHGTSFPQKPAPDALLECIKRLGVTPQDSIYVGNNLEKDMGMARRAGVAPVLIDRNAQTNMNQYPIVVNDLGKLLEIVK